jgi:hypothetical protein
LGGVEAKRFGFILKLGNIEAKRTSSLGNTKAKKELLFLFYRRPKIGRGSISK